ncbi:M20 family metallo-hydrolase [Virgibacillus oceani]
MNKGTSTINIERLMDTIEQSAKIGEIPGNGLRRLALSEEDRQMRNFFQLWMEEAGLQVRIDDFGNMYGRRKGRTDKRPVVIGSHLDTQPAGGRFDGVLGILSALEVVRTLNDKKLETERPVEIVNFTNEEGARFAPSMMGSGGMTGAYEKAEIYKKKDRNGKTFEAELEWIGYKGKLENRLQDIHSFVELHIEQGPFLEKESTSIGVVTGIFGSAWLKVTVSGEADHAGATPMNMRKDPLNAAAEMILAIEQNGTEHGGVATVGSISVSPDSINSIPGEVFFTIDLRHLEDKVKERALERMKTNMETIALNRGVSLDIKDIEKVEGNKFHPQIIELMEDSARDLGCSFKQLPSGAGHDARFMSDMAPTGMIFVPSVNGKSHVESELTMDEDIEKGVNVLFETVCRLANMDKDLN